MGNHVYVELVPKAKDMGAVLTCPKTTPAPIAPLKTIGNLSTQSGMTGTNIDTNGANVAQIDVGAKLTHGRHATDTYDNTTNVGAKLTQEKDVTEPPYLLKIKDKPCKEKTRTSTNILDTMDTNVTYEQVEVLVYGMPVFPTADPIIPLFPDFDEGNEGAQPEPTVKQTSVPRKDNTVKDCTVRIERLSSDEINVWIKKDTVPEFPAFVSEQTRDLQPQSQQQQLRIDQAPPPNIPIRSTRTTRPTKSYENMDVEEETNTSTSKKRKPRVSQTGPSTSRLAAHRFYLRNKANRSQPKPEKTTVKTVTKPTDKTSGELPRKELTTAPAAPKGKLVVTTHGVTHRWPRQRRFKCPDCDVIEKSRKMLNDHFKSVHHKLFCEECGQVFATPTGLSRHMYTHTKEDRHPCTHCEETCPFASDLQSHLVKHLKVPGYQCGHGNCQKWFKRKGERDKHARTHTAAELHCDTCEYTSHHIRNLRRHQTRHTNEKKLSCSKCDIRFKWYMELKHHAAKCTSTTHTDALDF